MACCSRLDFPWRFELAQIEQVHLTVPPYARQEAPLVLSNDYRIDLLNSRS